MPNKAAPKPGDKTSSAPPQGEESGSENDEEKKELSDAVDLWCRVSGHYRKVYKALLEDKNPTITDFIGAVIDSPNRSEFDFPVLMRQRIASWEKRQPDMVKAARIFGSELQLGRGHSLTFQGNHKTGAKLRLMVMDHDHSIELGLRTHTVRKNARASKQEPVSVTEATDNTKNKRKSKKVEASSKPHKEKKEEAIDTHASKAIDKHAQDDEKADNNVGLPQATENQEPDHQDTPDARLGQDPQGESMVVATTDNIQPLRINTQPHTPIVSEQGNIRETSSTGKRDRTSDNIEDLSHKRARLGTPHGSSPPARSNPPPAVQPPAVQGYDNVLPAHHPYGPPGNPSLVDEGLTFEHDPAFSAFCERCRSLGLGEERLPQLIRNYMNDRDGFWKGLDEKLAEDPSYADVIREWKPYR